MTPEQILRDGKLPWDAECNTTRAAMERAITRLRARVANKGVQR